jgi:DNA repair ATPase RecN
MEPPGMKRTRRIAAVTILERAILDLGDGDDDGSFDLETFNLGLQGLGKALKLWRDQTTDVDGAWKWKEQAQAKRRRLGLARAREGILRAEAALVSSALREDYQALEQWKDELKLQLEREFQFMRELNMEPLDLELEIERESDFPTLETVGCSMFVEADDGWRDVEWDCD